MLLNRGPSWRQRSRPQPVNQAQDLSEQATGEGNLGQLEGDVAAVPNHPVTDLDPLVPQRGQRPMLAIRWTCEFPPVAIPRPSGGAC